MTMSGKTAEKPILLSLIVLMISFVLFSCGSPGDWAEHTLGRDEAAALLYEADHLRHRARRALLRANPDPGIVTALTSVDVAYLTAALDAVSREWRSIDGYFESVGIGPTHRTKLLAVLAEPDNVRLARHPVLR